MLMEALGEINNAGTESIIHELPLNCVRFEGGLKMWWPDKTDEAATDERWNGLSEVAGQECDDLRGVCLIVMAPWSHHS